MIEHLDQDGKPCTRHVVAPDKLITYAVLGSRVSGFHHDTASKLQSLVMALDEISELIGEAESELRTATDTAQSAVRQLHALLSANRALAKPPQAQRTLLPELLGRAAERHAVKLRGEIGNVELLIAPPSMTHAFAVLLDMIAGPPSGGRAVAVAVEADGYRATLTLTGSAEATHVNANELIALAAFMVEREEGSFRCGPKSFVVELPVAQPSGFVRT